jgi:PAS domain S-box-containing protein
MKQPLKRPSRDYRQLQQIIVGLTDGVILIGTDQKIIWANDAALAMHGVGTIEELGATASAYRKRFRLRYRNNRAVERGRYPIERVVSRECFSDVTVEVRPAADPDQCWVHSIRSLVITDDSDVPDYLVLIVKDETDRFRAEDRFESAFNANPAPAIICRVSDLCYVRVNPGFLEMTGYARKDLLGATFHKIDVLAGAEKRDLALERLKEGRTIPQMEARLPLPDGGLKFVIIAGEPIEVGGESCMLFTFADLDPRVKAESALRQSEERFAKSFRLSPVPMAIGTLKGFKLVETNEAFKAMTGYVEEEIVGRSPAELNLWSDKAAQRQFELAIEKGGGVRSGDLQLRAKDDTLFDCLVSTDTVTINDERCVLFVIQDITGRKRSEQELMTAIEAVMADTSWFSRSVVEKLAALRQSSKPRIIGAELEDLTDRERDVLGLICQGLSDREMSATLKLSPNTIRNHVFSLYQKIGVNRRGAAIIWARERGITGREALTSLKRR